MFEACGLRIAITRGDSGLLTIEPREAFPFEDEDRAVFTVRRRNGGVLMRAVLKPDEAGRVQVPLLGEETAGWRPGLYEWDVRYVLGAVLGEDGDVEGGREVVTPMPPGAFTVLRAVGTV